MVNKPGEVGRILFFVEDEVDIVELYKIAFESEGFSINSFGTGTEAMAELKKYSEIGDGKPEAMILDILLPDNISGIDIMHEVRKNPIFKEVPIIMFTNFSSDKIREEIARTPNTKYLLKVNTTPTQLVAIVKEMLGIK